ncbi:MAG TPA: DHA2 family efflux MFS transporter permease subunit, partial [Marmoricola sp.]|nr:DHA2 family efflux MFS transporter permease subunit [Marmoricola sp.]
MTDTLPASAPAYELDGQVQAHHSRSEDPATVSPLAVEADDRTPPIESDTAAPSADGSAEPTSSGGWGLPLLVLIFGMFMSVLDTSIVNVAVPTIERAFGATTEQVAWIVTAYTLSLAVIVPLSAWLSERFGATRVYGLALVGFGVASGLCGLAWDLNSLIVFRVLQAIPGGLLPPLSMAILYRIVPPAQIGRAMGLFGLGVIVAPAVGPTLGGYLVEYVDWRLIFFINVPVGLAATIATFRILPTFPSAGRPPFDFFGFATIATGFFALLLALSQGESWGWTSFKVVALVCLALVMFALFVVTELEVDHPLLDIRAFKYWQFTNSLILISLLSIGLFTVLFYIPVFLQSAQGWGALDAGIVLLPQALVMAVVMPTAGQLYDRIGPRWPALVGLVICAYGTYLLHDLGINSPRHDIALILMLRAAGMALAMMPIMTGALAAVPQTFVASASAFNNVVQQASASLGLAILGAILTSTTAQFLADQAALMPASS